jgi:hypothetical protein
VLIGRFGLHLGDGLDFSLPDARNEKRKNEKKKRLGTVHGRKVMREEIETDRKGDESSGEEEGGRT